MKILKFIKTKATGLLSILFATGIAFSIATVYGFTQDPQQVSGVVVYTVIGLTFITGLYAIHHATRSGQHTVVYLDQKKSTDDNIVTIHDTDEQLTLEPLNKILSTGQQVSQTMINAISKQLEAGQTALYTVEADSLRLTHGFALSNNDAAKTTYAFGEGLVGRVAKEGDSLYIDSLPKGYIIVFSGLGSASPTYLAIVPLKVNGEVKAVLELALFKPLSKATLVQLETIGNHWAEAGL